MTGGKSKFLSLSESKSGNVTFGNDAPRKIKGKGMVSLSNGKGKSQDVLLVDGLKHNQQQTDRPQTEEGFIREPPFRSSSTPRYQTIFFGLFYACNNFGYKVMNCRANNINIKKFEIHTQKGYPRRPSETQRRSYNRFEHLITEVECYKCNNFGNMAKD
jgi:hypothetical protein